MSRRRRKRERIYAHVLSEIEVGQTANSKDLIQSWNQQNHDTISTNSFGQIMRGLIANGTVERHQEWIEGRTLLNRINRRSRTRGIWVTTYRRLK